MKEEDANSVLHFLEETKGQLEGTGWQARQEDIIEFVNLIVSIIATKNLSQGAKDWFFKLFVEEFPEFLPECQAQGLVAL